MHRVVAALAVAAVAAAGIAIAIASEAGSGNHVGPASRIQPNGRQVRPAGKLTRVGNHPGGGALTANGRFLWTLSAGRSRNDIRIVQVESRRAREIGRVVQTIPMPGLSGGIAMAPDGRTAYVSGIRNAPREDLTAPPGVPGKGGDVIHVFTYDGKRGTAKRAGTIGIPPPSNAPTPQDFPPGATDKQSWPRDLAVSPNGRTLLAALNLADSAAVVDLRTRTVRYVQVGHYPYGAGITRDGKLGLVSNETPGTVSVIDLATATRVKDLKVGPRLSHPEGIAIDPRTARAYVALANQDLIAVLDTARLRVERTLSVARPQGTGTSPVALTVSPGGCLLLSSDAGEDAIALFALPGRHGTTCRDPGGPRRHRVRLPGPFRMVGRIPVAAYPVAAQISKRRTLAWLAAKGLGVGPNHYLKDDADDTRPPNRLPYLVRGYSGVLRVPSVPRLREMTPVAARELIPVNSKRPPKGTPIRPPGRGPIKHVFYLVRENRSYDQVMGDEPRGNGDPKLTLFGKRQTPNYHALAKRFPLLDHVFANSEASIDGHYWTAAGGVSDYVVKNWQQNYADRGRPYDFGGYVVSAPPRGYIFERAEREGVGYFNYGEALAGLSPLPDKDRSDAETAQAARILAHSDIGTPQPGCYDSDLSNSTVLSLGQVDVYDSSLPPGANPTAHSRFECFRTRFLAQVAGGTVPAFNYLVLPNNHTEGTTPGRRTPDAQIASNDWGLGQIVDLISHSPIWKASVILVVEDDSQDGGDHIDAHRIPALAISPYARRGAVIHTRYDQISFLRTAEILIGLKPRHLAEALAVPLYDAFGASPGNAEPYTAIVPNVTMTARNTAATPGARRSSELPLDAPDRVPQRTLDRLLWQYRHGPHSEPPPPGPNASGEEGDG